jgi:hypothetical protein
MQMRTTSGGSDVTSSAATIESAHRTGEDGFHAFDDNLSTYWQADGTSGQWIGQDFGAGNEKDIVEITMQLLSGVTLSRGMREFDVQYSDDNSTWTTSWSVTTTWPSTAQQTFTKPSAVASRYWRVRCNLTYAGLSSMSCAEMELRESSGGSDATGSGTASASTTAAGTAAVNAFDNDTSTIWSGNSDVAASSWLRYDFGSGVTKSIVQVSFTARNDATLFNQAPASGWVESSTDGVNFLPRISFSGLSWSQGSTNLIPSSGGSGGRRRQLINC